MKNLAVFGIKRWDSVIPSIKNGPMTPNPLPMIYIKSTQKLIDYAKQKDYIIQVMIKDTNSIYDHKIMNATFNTEKYIKTYGPLSPNVEDYQTLMLHSYFYEYPFYCGNLVVLGLNK